MSRGWVLGGTRVQVEVAFIFLAAHLFSSLLFHGMCVFVLGLLPLLNIPQLSYVLKKKIGAMANFNIKCNKIIYIRTPTELV
jgi:hypothetical protein